MIVVTFTSDEAATVSFEASDTERLRKACEKTGVSREPFIKAAIESDLTASEEAEKPSDTA